MNLAMPLPTTNYDTHTVDTSSRRGQRQNNDNSSKDPHDFGGALADVADPGTSNRDASQKTKNASATDSTPATGNPAPDAPQAAAQNPTFVNALTDLLSQALQSKSGTKAPTSDGGKNGASTSKGDAAGKQADDTAAPAPGADLMAMMMAAGLAPRPATSAAPQQSAASTAKSPTLPAAAASATDETPEVILSKPVVETHLAPVTPATGAGAAQTGAGSSGPASFADALAAKANAAKANAQATTPATNLSAPQPSPTSSGAQQSATQSGGDKAGQELSSSAAAALQQAAAHNLTPAQSAIRSIAAAVGELANQPASPVQVPDANAQPAVAPARTMTLQMSPPDLGTVDIRLHVTGDSLDVQLKLSNSETLGMVHRDREALSTALQDQNYKLNSLVIQDGGASASSGGQNAAAQGGGSASYSRPDQDSGRASQNNGQGGGQRPQPDDSGSGRPRSGPERRPSSGGDLRSGGLFI